MGERKTKSSIISEFVKRNFVTITMSFFVLQLANFLSFYLFHDSFFSVSAFLFFMTFGSFVFLKDFATDDQKKIGIQLIKLSLVVFACSLINGVFAGISESLSDPEKISALLRLSYFLHFGVLIGSLAFFRNEWAKELFQNIYEKSILEKLRLKSSSEQEKGNGNIQICVDAETEKPVMLKYVDRFLHMLILGPTGSGKTSQVIIPMINQDIQNRECGITVLEPKGDLAEKVYAMAEYYGRKAIYFNPILPNCPYFNPLYGKEEDVIENMATTFKMLNTDSPQFFKDMNETLIRNALKVLKRLYGNKATLIDLSRMLYNSGGEGRKMVMQFSRLNASSEEIAKENADIASWFLNDYFNEKTKTYEHCSGLRSQVSKITSNKYLRKVLNPPNGENDVDFDKHLENGGLIAISTAQGSLRDLGRFLGYFIILQFQSSVFRRPGNEDTRRPHFLYIDEFQVYSNPGFADMLTQGRSYRVASHLATQNRALIGMGSGQAGKDFVELVSTNARNVIIFPGGNAADAKYYSEQFGEVLKKEVHKSVARKKFNPLKGFKSTGYNTETLRFEERKTARFSPSDIIYRPFGEVTYCIIRDNSICPPGVGRIQYIPKELNDRLNEMVEDYKRSVFASEDEDTRSFVQDQEEEKEIVQADPVVSDEDTSEFLYRGKDVIDPDDDFIDDFVIEGTGEDSNNKRDLDYNSEIEDDLI